IRYGGLPEGYKDKYGDIDKKTLQLASQNEQSDTQRINRQYNDNVFAFKRALAARGALNSGDLQYGLDRADLAKESALYDAANAFGDAARQAVSGYLTAEQNAKMMELQGLAAASSSILSNPAYAPVPQQSARLVSNR